MLLSLSHRGEVQKWWAMGPEPQGWSVTGFKPWSVLPRGLSLLPRGMPSRSAWLILSIPEHASSPEQQLS